LAKSCLKVSKSSETGRRRRRRRRRRRFVAPRPGTTLSHLLKIRYNFENWVVFQKLGVKMDDKNRKSNIIF
jgi:hypothetical protein